MAGGLQGLIRNVRKPILFAIYGALGCGTGALIAQIVLSPFVPSEAAQVAGAEGGAPAGDPGATLQEGSSAGNAEITKPARAKTAITILGDPVPPSEVIE